MLLKFIQINLIFWLRINILIISSLVFWIILSDILQIRQHLIQIRVFWSYGHSILKSFLCRKWCLFVPLIFRNKDLKNVLTFFPWILVEDFGIIVLYVVHELTLVSTQPLFTCQLNPQQERATPKVYQTTCFFSNTKYAYLDI